MRRIVWLAIVIVFLLSALRCTLNADQLPSVFRGLIVADSPLGVRIVSVETGSQAEQADVRPQDVVVSIDGREVHSIDDFAQLSAALKGQARAVAVLVFRNGSPHTLSLHLYSYPLLRAWGLEFVPDFDLRFAQPEIGRDYWARQGQGFEVAGKLPQALDAYLNALHQMPQDVPTAMHLVGLWLELSRQQFAAKQTAAGVKSLHQAVQVLQKLFDYPLSDAQLEAVKLQLQHTLDVLRHLRTTPT